PNAEKIDPLRKFSARYLNIATSLRRQDAPPKYEKSIYAWTDAVATYGTSLWDFAQAMEQRDVDAMTSKGKKISDAFEDVNNKFAPLSSAYHDQCAK
ncbi:MAG TPA: hypothetical protein VII92_03225, partial [Anaerolineae bacterium]